MVEPIHFTPIPGVEEVIDDLHAGLAAIEYACTTADARSNVTDFFPFVMKEEKLRSDLTLAPHQEVLFAFVDAFKMSVVRMPVGASKCVEENTLIVDPKSGRRVAIRDVVDDPYFTHVHTWGKPNGVHTAPISAKHDTGSKVCLRLTTRGGRELLVTPEHPMLTPGGWLRSDELVIGDTLASVGKSPEPIEARRMCESEVFLLALLIAEGCTTTRAGFSTGDPTMLALATHHADRIGCDVKHRGAYDYDIVGRKWHSNPVLDLVRQHGLFDCKATEKQIPDALFSLPNDQLADFLGTVWQCDGYVSKSPAIALANKRLVETIAHLLLRFGIKSTINEQPNDCAGAWRLSVRSDSFEAFGKHIPIYGYKKSNLIDICAKKRNPNVGFPRIRKDVRERVRRIASDIPCVKRFTKGKTSDFHRSASNEFRLFVKDAPEFAWWFDESIDWDEITAIENAGMRRVFDLTMVETSCFVANDLIAHNTFCMAALTLHLLGKDSTQRGAIVSSTQSQASKVVKMVSDYITDSHLNAPLQGVFPNLRRSHRDGDAWTQTKLVVERPAGIRDASLTALGIGTAVLGSRFSWILCDDILSQENTYTPDSREKVHRFFEGSILSRVDPGPDAKVVVTNTPWNQDDITYRLANMGWPTVTMSIYGDITFENVDWTQPNVAYLKSLIRPSTKNPDQWRLRSHDPDPFEMTPLWPERYSIAEIQDIRDKRLPQQFAQSYLCQAVDDASSYCSQAWVDVCVERGNGLDLVHSYKKEQWPEGAFTVTGVDLASKKKTATALTVIFTVLVMPNQDMQILNIDAGRYKAPQIRDLVIAHHDRYDSCVFVEDNGVQTWMLDMIGEHRSIPVWPFSTGTNKHHPAYGIQSVFLLMSQGKWIIPSTNGKMSKLVTKWINECKGFSPNAHTGDLLMASWFCKEGSRVVRQNMLYFFKDKYSGPGGVRIFGTDSPDAAKKASEVEAPEADDDWFN